MNRSDNFSLRLTTAERQIITTIAQTMDRTPSDAVRVVLREKARELGVLPTTKDERRPQQPSVSV